MTRPIEVPISAQTATHTDPRLLDLEQATRTLAPVEEFMERALDSLDLPSNLLEATRYALLGGGKRLRPLLVLYSGLASGHPIDRAVPAAAAVEMVHAFSLVHDDLPALDNDDTRRGKPTVHKACGEAMAILVGDGLMSMAFQILTLHYPPPIAGRLCRELAAGSTAMIAGQVLDTLGGFAADTTPRRRLELVHRNKTGALIRASCRMGPIAAGLPDSDPRLAALTAYGDAVGLMFQIVDDLVDVLQTSDHAGKRTGKDSDAGKLTYPGVLGLEESAKEVERLRLLARTCLEPCGTDAAPLAQLSDYLAVRTR
ncbi:MAG: polyprenyl synthetase family protein [Planctomycetota bacterium]|nr:polyprenyl synthetase family protein [Planctomycetota bacterium]